MENKSIGELLPIENKNGLQAVNARFLYEWLEVKKHFPEWFSTQIRRCDLVENVDYQCLGLQGAKPNGGRPIVEYALSINAAKEISMMSQTEKGKQARRYFIECERIAKSLLLPSYQIADPIKRAERWIEEEKERQLLQAQNKKMLPKAEYYDEVLQKKSTFTMTEVADEMGLSVHKLTKELICHDIIYKASGRYLLKVPFKGWRLHETRTPNNAHATPYLVWNERGRMFIHKLRDNNWNARATIKEINPEWNGSLQIDCNAAS